MDPFNAPANTCTPSDPPGTGNYSCVLGTVQPCARIDENNVLDADEDVTADTVTFDITATNIKASNPMISYNYVVNYSEAPLSLQTADHNFLIAANGLSAFNVSDPLPDTDANDRWTGTMIDTGTTDAEFGSGTLTRLTISSDAPAVAGEYPLTLTEATIIAPDNLTYPPDTINPGAIAINQPCGGPGVTSLAGYVARLYSAIVNLAHLGR